MIYRIFTFSKQSITFMKPAGPEKDRGTDVKDHVVQAQPT